jgi:hypothetical protein
MELVQLNSREISDGEKEIMFQMYIDSNLLGGKMREELWFQSKEALFARYPCFITYKNTETSANMHLIVTPCFSLENIIIKFL